MATAAARERKRTSAPFTFFQPETTILLKQVQQHMSKYKNLMSSGRIGPMEVRNRILLAAMGTSLAEADGSCGERIRKFHEEQARGGLGMVTMGVVSVGWPQGSVIINQPALSDDRYIPGLRAVAETVHSHGAKFAVQLHFGGQVALNDMIAGRPVWTPSLPEVKAGDMMDGFLFEEMSHTPFFQVRDIQFRVMTTEDIAELIEMFRSAARRAREAGVDGLEIHGGHGYLLSSFLSPASNKRTDAYGGPLENRARLLIEILRAVREAAGPDIAVWCKIDALEYGREGGISLEDAIATAKMVEAAGADAITCTAYHETSRGALHSGSHTPDRPGLNVDKAARIKKAISIPVIVSGRLEPDAADQALGNGSADFVMMGRKLLADPHLPRKLAEEREADILPCIYCYTCISAIYYGTSARCAVNAQTAFEQEDWAQPALQPRHVVVIGGGPGGMEAARRLARRGHRVTLLEQSDRLGGTLQFASIAYEPNERILNWLKREIQNSAVDVRLNVTATPELIASLAADEVVVATGGRRDAVPLPGHDKPHVLSGDDLRRLVLGGDMRGLEAKTGLATRLMAKTGALTGATKSPAFIREATKAWMPVGKSVVIIGGDLVGLELAEFLVERGRRVTVIDDNPKFGAGLQIVRRWRVLDELRHSGVSLRPNHSGIAIEDGSVTAIDPDTNAPVSFDADTVIIAKGATGDTHLADALQAAGHKVHPIGDCTGIGYIEGAIRAGAEVARTL